MLRYFVSVHFAFLPRKLSSGRVVWFRRYYTVQRYLDHLGDLMLSYEQYSSLTEKAADQFRLFLEGSSMNDSTEALSEDLVGGEA